MSDVVRNAIPHLRLVFGGTMGAAQQEIWACSLKLVGQTVDGATGNTKVQTGTNGQLLDGALALASSEVAAIVDTGGAGGPNLADALNVNHLPAIKALWQQLGRIGAWLTFAKLNGFGADDRQLNQSTVEAQFAPLQGSLQAGVPFSSAVVAELRSATRTRGVGSHARFLFPGGLNMDGTTGKILTMGSRNQGGGANLIGDEHQYLEAFLAALNIQGTADLGTQFVPSIVYTGLPNHVYKKPGVRNPTFNPVTRAFWSDIPGEVRRRQNKLKQGQTAVAITYGPATA